ncbi:MAG: hypothetical protein DRQ13_11185, partial [Ignavibacteriae bacterium]
YIKEINMKIIITTFCFLMTSTFCFTQNLIIESESEVRDSQVEFVQHEVTGSFIKGADVIAVDLDQDEDMDIISVNSHTSAEIAWWQNNGFNEFTKITIRDNLNKTRSVRAEDVNDDGHIDLVVAVYGENRILYLENNGDETFSDYEVDANFVGAHTIDIKDVNDDDHLDILCSGFDFNYHNGEIAWWINDGQSPIGWTKQLISNRFQQSPFIYGEDMDGDDDMDVIACGELNDEILWWENDGDENFTEHMVDSLINGIHTVIARDVDLDGDMDILAAACIGSQVAWYENDGNQNFNKHPLGYFAGALWLDATDLDNDGDRDLFGAPQGANQLAWWENPGNQQFIKHNFDNTFTQSFCVVPAMMDNDNDTDLVAIGWQSNKISWFENRLEDPNLLNQPESVVFDSLYNRYLVSNWGDGNIIEISISGEHSYFNTELDQAAGLHIVGNVVYVASSNGSNTGIIGIDLATGGVVFDVDIIEKQLLNDITSDTSGNLYVTDCEADKIFKVRISNMTYSTFVESGLGYPNGVLFDKPNNRLLVLNGELPGGPIVAVDLEDSSLTTVVNTNLTAIDGLTTDQFRNFYFSSWATDKVYRYDASLTNPPEVISSGHTNPADIYYNQLNDVLAVPNFHANIVDFIPITHTEVVEVEYPPNYFRLMQNYPNPFNPTTTIKYQIQELSFVTLKVYDVLGNEITTLVNEDKPNGSYEVEFSTTGEFASGAYFYQLKAGSYLETKKMVFLR